MKLILTYRRENWILVLIRTQYQYWNLFQSFDVICSLSQEKRSPKAYKHEALRHKQSASEISHNFGGVFCENTRRKM
jgi:hypothetical protein